MPIPVLVKGHGWVNFPDGTSPEEMNTALDRDFPPPPPTVGETAKSAFGAGVQGAADVLASPLQAIGITEKALTGDEAPAEETLPYRAGQAVSDYVRQAFPEDPRLAGKSFLWSTFPRGAGSTGGFWGLGALGQLARIPAVVGTMAAGAAAQGVQGFQEARQAGVDDATAFKSFLLNAGVGTSEAIPLEHILSRINRATGGKVRTAIDMMLSGGEEAVQESGQQALSNVIAENLYDSDRDVFQDVAASGGAGALTGALFHLAGRGVRRALGRDNEPAGPLEGLEIKAPQNPNQPPGEAIPEETRLATEGPDRPTSDIGPEVARMAAKGLSAEAQANLARQLAKQTPPTPAPAPAPPVQVTKDLAAELQASLKGNQLAPERPAAVTTPAPTPAPAPGPAGESVERPPAAPPAPGPEPAPAQPATAPGVLDGEAETFGLPARPSPDFLLVRVLPETDVATPEGVARANSLVDALNPSAGLVETTASMARNDAAKVSPDALAQIGPSATPAQAQAWLRSQIQSGVIDRNTRSQIAASGPQSLDYLQRLLIQAAYRSDPVAEVRQDPRTLSTARGLIDAAVPPLLELRARQSDGTASALTQLITRTFSYTQQGMPLDEALRQVYSQDEAGDTASDKLARSIAGILQGLIERHPPNKRGIQSIDSETTTDNFRNVFNRMATAIRATESEGDLFGSSRTPEEAVRDFVKGLMGGTIPMLNEGEPWSWTGGESPATLTDRPRRRTLPGHESAQLQFNFTALAQALSGPVASSATGRTLQLGPVQVTASEVVTDLKSNGSVSLTGQPAHTNEQAAVLFRLFRDPSVETTHYLFTKQGKVVGRYTLSANLPGTTYVYDPRAGVAPIKALAQQFGADAFWICHNHPSGDPSPSAADFTATAHLAMLMGGFQGHIIIDHTRYAVLDAFGGHVIRQFPAHAVESSDPTRRSPSGQPLGHLLGKPLTGSVEAAAVSRQVLHQSGDVASMAFISARGFVRALGHVSVQDLMTPGIEDHIREAARAVGALRVVSFLPSKAGAAAINQAARLTREGLFVESLVDHKTAESISQGGQWLGLNTGQAESRISTATIHEEEAPYQAGDANVRRKALEEIDRLDAQRRAARRKGDAKTARDLEEQIQKIQKEVLGFSGMTEREKEDAAASPRPESHPGPLFPPPTPGPAQPKARPMTRAAQVASMDVVGATAAPEVSSDVWWDKLKRGLRGFVSNTPEVPLSGPKAERAGPLKRFIRMTHAETERVRDVARQRVEHIIKPLLDLGRQTLDPNTRARFQALTNQIQAEQAKPEPNVRKMDQIQAEREKLLPKLNANPFHLFQSRILWGDIWYRSNFVRTEDGDTIQPPAGLTPADVEQNLRATDAAIQANPDRAAIEDAIQRHYAFVESMQKELEAHGEVIPDELKNPLYFPHHLLESWTGQLSPVRVSTEGDFRYYLVPPVGTAKLHQSDYVAAMYKHAADVLAHNARMDLVEKYVKPYDTSAARQKELESEAAHKGTEVSPDAWKQEKNLPPGYRLFAPSKVLPLSASYLIDRASLTDALGKAIGEGDLLTELRKAGVELTVTADDLRQALAVGEKVEWLLPTEIADALDGIARRETLRAERAKDLREMGPLVRFAHNLPANTLKVWKWNVLFNPLNYIRYEYGNTMTDVIDKVFGLDPAVGGYLKRAMREVREGAKGNRTEEYEAAMKEGVLQTVTASEVADLDKLEAFEDLLSDGKRALNNWNKIWRMTTGMSRLRESTFRYAKFLADVERMREGKKPVYGGAYWRDVEALDDLYARAGTISRRTFGDPAELSVYGDVLRRLVFPFWSWQEVNLKYHANLFRNLYDAIRLREAGSPGLAGRAVAASTSRAALGIALRLAMMRLMAELWNQFGGHLTGLWDKDEDLEGQLSETDRRKMHITLGKDANGKVRVLYLPNALSDVAEWVGGNNFARLFVEWTQKKITLGQFAEEFSKQMPADFGNKLASSARPDAKFAYMMVSGLDPGDITNQRRIDRSDWRWILAQQVVDRDIFQGVRHVVDPDYYSPESMGDWLQRKILQVRRRDPEQWQYYEIRQKVADWIEEKTGKRDEGGSVLSKDQVVLRNFRKAIYNGDQDAAVKFYARALELGYTAERFKSSLRAQNPLSALSVPDRKAFIEGLSAYEMDQLEAAMRFYSRLQATQGRESVLFPRQPSPAFQPNFGKLTQILEQREGMPDAEASALAHRLIETAGRGR